MACRLLIVRAWLVKRIGLSTVRAWLMKRCGLSTVQARYADAAYGPSNSDYTILPTYTVWMS
ncbi:hypothetical protein ASG81_23660 [Paenibacillus sp. Soil522]|nr:hypothetical protein ASG81_23660 [Paenibacillus sp. Soil522]